MRAVVILLLVGAVSLSQTACRSMLSKADAEETGLIEDSPLWAWLTPEVDSEPEPNEPIVQTVVDSSSWFENSQSHYSTFYSAYYDQWYYTQYYGGWYCETCDAWHYPQSYTPLYYYYHDPDGDGEDGDD